MTFQIDSFDFHSGLKEIHWQLHDLLESDVLHGSGRVAVHRHTGNMSDCVAPSCYCIPKDNECFLRYFEINPDMSKMVKPRGDHDFDYQLVLNVTNNAMLSSTFTFKITVDTTAPLPGVVSDSEQSEPDIDFQQGSTQHATWQGFFDRESGIVFYQYAFYDHCLTASDFSFPPTGKVNETTLTYASRTASDPGTYHCTVVAYNKALEPSEPVCSDGVTVDTTAPEIYEVSIENSWTKDGLVKDSTGDVWYIDRNRFRVRIDQPSEICREKSRLESNVSMYRIKEIQKSSGESNVTLCTKQTFEDRPIIVINKENMLELSWFGSDAESGIHAYEVGLSSTGSEDMDLLPYTSTHGHRHFITYHPDLMDGETFYIHIKAVNRAGQQTVQMTGPITVQVDAPTFSGNIAVAVQEHNGIMYMVGRWNISGFSAGDVQDGLIYGYSYAVGLSPITDDVNNFALLTQESSVSGLCTWTDPPTCVATPVGDLQWRLHGRNTYYVTLKLEGVNGLDGVTSSKEYAHYVGPPSAGVVVEIPVNTNELMSEDIDHQSSESRLHVAWYGFQHVDQTISYELAVGTAPGKEDVVGFVDVDSSSKLLINLALQPFKTYFASVRASTQDGSTIVSSDGVIVLPVDTPLEGAAVLDAMPCSPDGSQSDISLSHHGSAFPNLSCEVDIDFQSSVTHMGIQWSLPANLTTFVTTIKWGLQKSDSNDWLEFRELTYTSGIEHVIATDLHLEPGRTYRAAIKFCHPEGCFLPVYSNGVTITPDAPMSTGIISTSLTDTNLTFTWSRFMDPSIHARTATAASRHEWTLLIDHLEGQSPGHLYPWQLMVDVDINCNQTSSTNDVCSYTTHLAAPLETSSCVVLALRVYNKVGLYSTVRRPLRGCDVTSKVKLIVNDAVATTLDGDIALENNDLWPMSDREYTPSSSTLSAVWPDLRHGTYHWKVVSDDAIRRFAYVQPETAPDYSDYDCLAPEVLACGVTQDSFVNVHDLSLNEGQRYHICILANATDILVENVTKHLEQNSECSNGIVVDRTPPSAGQVWVGSRQKHWQFQIDRSRLSIYWSSFVDVETYGSSSHHSGILKYEYAIGTSPEGDDVRDYVEVGVTNMAVATGLVLKDGMTYYVTVRATDHVGRSTLSQSPGVTIDSTPPDVSAAPIEVGGSYVIDRTALSVAWTGTFSDDESGIDHFYWCVGSKPGYCDMMAYVETTELQTSTRPQDDLRLKDGHLIYVSVQAVNKVGLIAVSTSRAVVVDGSPPVAGHVYDVISDAHTKDVDYTTVASEIGAKWSGFNDPHSHVTGYSVSIGKCRYCVDILEKSHVGITSSIHVVHVTLERGVTYYTTVEACNGAGLCVTVTSDGVIADTSPPVAGDLFDGISTEDVDYQSSRSMLSAHWLDFHDPESGLLYLEWRAGTTPGHSDILAPTRLHLTDQATATLIQQLPVGKRVYVTLKVFNKAGLSTEITSDGFIVDNTAPVTTSRVALNSRLGSLKKDTQVWTSSLSVQWQMTDKESSIIEQFVSLTTRDSVHHDVSAVKLHGDGQAYTFSNVSLADGEMYYAKVIACNGARLCTTSVSEGILIDSIPPVAGAFAVETDHAAALTRHRIGWMTYESNTLHLAWVGFSDAHADVMAYYVSVGTQFGYWDMVPTDTPVKITHTTDDWHGDEGFVQKANIFLTSAIQQNQQLYISLWAENKVGLVSSRLHGTFTAVPSQSAAGTLALLRRCQPVTCEGHCTCAPHGQLTCASTGGCVNVKGKPGYQQLSVYDIEDYTVTPESNKQDIDFIRSQSALAATWRPAATPGNTPARYEWTVGVDGHPVGDGLLDVHKEPIWRETGHGHMAVYTTRSSRELGVVLQSHAKYVVYVRAWYDAVSYAVYVTDGVMTDSSPPELSRAAKVTELQSATTKGDVDFITSTSNVTLSWRGVFRDSQAAIRRYVACISKNLGGRDVAEKQITSSVTKTTFNNLTLDASDVYYCTVVSYNDAGLFRSAYSDGFKVDMTPPVTGQVWDGRGLTDQDYSRDNRRVAAWWRGFSDDQSYISHYVWCVGTEPGKEDVMTCRDVGLHTHRTAHLPSAQVSGTRLYSTVYAVNGAGLKSAGVSSDGVVIDSSPPLPLHKFRLGRNLLKNPSFEEDTSQPGTQEAVPREWTGHGTFYLKSSAGDDGRQDGHMYLEIVGGYIEQTVATTSMTKYRVTFYVHSPNNDRFHSQQLGFVRLPRVHAAFAVASTTASSGEWQKHVYYFIATDSRSTARVGAVGHKTGFLLDNVQVQEVGLGQRSSSPDQNNSPMHVHVTSRGSYTAVTAAWDVEDPESPVTGYSWAIGTVRGGVQLQNFRSVGVQTHARADALLLQQGTEVHVTVVTKNAAGLNTAIYSDPLTIDLTPPVLCCLVDGVSEVATADQTSRILTITWSVKDPESRVSYCEWAVGKSPGSQEVQPFTRTTSLSTASMKLNASFSHGETVFSIARCFNYADLQSTLVSSGVVIVTEPPDVSMATLNIITSSPSHYPARDNHQADSQRLFFGWEGIRDRAGIEGYEVSLQRTGSATPVPWQGVASASQLYATLQGLGLQSYSTYTLLLRVTNTADLTSDVIATNVTIETDVPRVTHASLQSRWPHQSTLTIDWTGVFTCNSSLVYEINIGTTRSGIDVLSWLDTERTVLHVTRVDHTKEHYVTLTAINKAGLYTTRMFVVAYSPMAGFK